MKEFLNKKNIFNLLLLAIMVLAIPLTVRLVRYQQVLLSRAEAAKVEFLTKELGGTDCVVNRGGKQVALCNDIKVRFSAPTGSDIKFQPKTALLPKIDLVSTVYAGHDNFFCSVTCTCSTGDYWDGDRLCHDEACGGHHCDPPPYEYPTPAYEYPTPAYEYPTPAYEYPTPAYEYPTPAYEYPTPAYEYPTPAYEYPTPGGGPTCSDPFGNPGDTTARCNGNSVDNFTCNSSGQWDFTGNTACGGNQHCENNQCVDNTAASCTDPNTPHGGQATRCNGNSVDHFTCDNGNWLFTSNDSCGANQFCENGQCKDSGGGAASCTDPNTPHGGSTSKCSGECHLDNFTCNNGSWDYTGSTNDCTACPPTGGVSCTDPYATPGGTTTRCNGNSVDNFTCNSSGQWDFTGNTACGGNQRCEGGQCKDSGSVSDCRDNPQTPPSGYIWKANCSASCNTNNDCPKNEALSETSYYDSSNWCYGFTPSSKCLQLQSTGSGGTVPCFVCRNKTWQSDGNGCSANPPPPTCSPTNSSTWGGCVGGDAVVGGVCDPAGEICYVCRSGKYDANASLGLANCPKVCDPKTGDTCKSSQNLQGQPCATQPAPSAAGKCFVCINKVWRDDGNGCSANPPTCNPTDPNTWGGCQGGNVVAGGACDPNGKLCYVCRSGKYDKNPTLGLSSCPKVCDPKTPDTCQSSEDLQGRVCDTASVNPSPSPTAPGATPTPPGATQPPGSSPTPTAPGATQPPGGTPTTPPLMFVKVRFAENPTDLASNPKIIDYPQGGITTPFSFSDTTPGQKFIFVQFEDNQGNLTEAKNAPITYSGPDPVITGASCNLDLQECVEGSTNCNLPFILIGDNFGNRDFATSNVSADGTNLEIREWTGKKVVARLNNPPDTSIGKTFTITLNRADGVKGTATCSINTTQISFGAKLICRNPSNFDQDNVSLTIAQNTIGVGGTNSSGAPAFQSSGKQKETVIITKDGVVTPKTKLQEGLQYKTCIKAPKSLRVCTPPFVAIAGNNIIQNFTLDVGDLNTDDIINSPDASLCKSEWGQSKTGSRACEFNRDNFTNSFEWACLLRGFGKTSEAEP